MNNKDRICQNINQIKKQIAQVCAKANRDPGEITIVAASKYVNAEQILDASSCSLTVFGENRVQDFIKKKEEVAGKVCWHFIGHLQTNKVKLIVGQVDLIQSVDSLKLAKVINKEAEKKKIIQNILIEVNVASEPTKYGFKLEELGLALPEFYSLDKLKVEGLMTILPNINSKDKLKLYFRQMKKLFNDLKLKLNCDNINMKYLSMGMSNDFLTAIEEGSNMVRIGSAIFTRG